MAGGDVVYTASCGSMPADGGDVGSGALSMLSALSIEDFILSFCCRILHSMSCRVYTLTVSNSAACTDTDPLTASRSRRSLSFSCVHLLRSSAQLVQPFCRATVSGLTPCLSGRSGCAPWRRRVRTTCSWPFAAAKWRGVEPEVPTMGAEVSLCLSLEYFRGSLGWKIKVSQEIMKNEVFNPSENDRCFSAL